MGSVSKTLRKIIYVLIATNEQDLCLNYIITLRDVEDETLTLDIVTTQLLITKEEMMELEIFVKWIKEWGLTKDSYVLQMKQKDKKPSHDSTKITRQLQAQWKEAKRGHITSYVEYKCLERELKATKEENGDLSKELVEMKSQFHGKGRKISQRYAKTWKVAWRRTT